MSRADNLRILENRLRAGLRTLRERIHPPVTCTCNNVWGRYVCMSTVEEVGGNRFRIRSQERELESWSVGATISLFALDDMAMTQVCADHILSELVKKAEQIEVQKFLQVGGECTCYQLDDWNWLETPQGHILKEHCTVAENGERDIDGYEVHLIKYAIIL